MRGVARGSKYNISMERLARAVINIRRIMTHCAVRTEGVEATSLWRRGSSKEVSSRRAAINLRRRLESITITSDGPIYHALIHEILLQSLCRATLSDRSVLSDSVCALSRQRVHFYYRYCGMCVMRVSICKMWFRWQIRRSSSDDEFPLKLFPAGNRFLLKSFLSEDMFWSIFLLFHVAYEVGNR